MKFKGFTVIELLVSMSIIAILTTIGLVTFSTLRAKAQDARIKSDLDSIKKVYESNYDLTLNGGQGGYKQLSTDGINSTYFADGKIPKQPNGSPYLCAIGPDPTPASGTYGCVSQNSGGYSVSAVLPSNNSTVNAISNLGTLPPSLLNSCDPGGILSNGLIAYWKMNDSWSDSKGTYTGTPNGSPAPTFVAGPPNGVGSSFGNAGNFSGTATELQSIIIPTELSSYFVSTNNKSALTISAWVTGFTGTQTYIFYTPGGLDLRIGSGSSTSQLGFSIRAGGVYSVLRPAAPSFNLSSSAWHHIAGTYDGITGGTGMKLYIDGIEKGTVAKTGTIGLTAGKAYIGSTGNTSGVPAVPYYTGQIDDVRIYDRALSAAEIGVLTNKCVLP